MELWLMTPIFSYLLMVVFPPKKLLMDCDASLVSMPPIDIPEIIEPKALAAFCPVVASLPSSNPRFLLALFHPSTLSYSAIPAVIAKPTGPATLANLRAFMAILPSDLDVFLGPFAFVLGVSEVFFASGFLIKSFALFRTDLTAFIAANVPIATVEAASEIVSNIPPESSFFLVDERAAVATEDFLGLLLIFLIDVSCSSIMSR